jgi:hypothetical protein
VRVRNPGWAGNRRGALVDGVVVCSSRGGSRIAVERNGRYFWQVTASTSA